MKKFCKKVESIADLNKGDRVLVVTPYSKQAIGYVESLSPMGDGTTCAYLDIRWRTLRAKCEFWASDKSGIPAGQKFMLVFNHDTLYVTNMKLNKALAHLNIKPFTPRNPDADCPF